MNQTYTTLTNLKCKNDETYYLKCYTSILEAKLETVKRKDKSGPHYFIYPDLKMTQPSQRWSVCSTWWRWRRRTAARTSGSWRWRKASDIETQRRGQIPKWIQCCLDSSWLVPVCGARLRHPGIRHLKLHSTFIIITKTALLFAGFVIHVFDYPKTRKQGKTANNEGKTQFKPF